MNIQISILGTKNRADHIDLNFGCPVPKVTRKGGGAALPYKQDLFAAIVNSAVKAAGEIPVTVKIIINLECLEQSIVGFWVILSDVNSFFAVFDCLISHIFL